MAWTLLTFLDMSLAKADVQLAAQAAELTKNPTISIEGSAFVINGKKVWLGESLAMWQKTLPGKARCISSKSDITLCVWDEIGVDIGTDEADKTRVVFINVELVPDKNTLGNETSQFSPLKSFPGLLSLDGIPILPTTRFRDLRNTVPARWGLSCGGHDCSNPTGNFQDVGSIRMDISARTDQGTIERFSVSCPYLQRCMNIVPQRPR